MYYASKCFHVRVITFLCAMCLLLVLPGCPGKGKLTTILKSVLDGRAIDANIAKLKDEYNGPGKAIDGNTEGYSNPATPNELSGGAVAVQGPKEWHDDRAEGVSQNKVHTEFVVTKAGTFRLHTELAVEGLKIVEDGWVEIQTQTIIQDMNEQTPKDANGKPIPNTHVNPRMNFKFELDSNGKIVGIVEGSTDKPKEADAKGNYGKTLRGSNTKVKLPVGKYQIKMELNIYARAPVHADPDPIAEAHVKKAVLTLKLK
jgi:hypothetical protein